MPVGSAPSILRELTEAVAEARADEREKCARICDHEEIAHENRCQDAHTNGLSCVRAARRIRALDQVSPPPAAPSLEKRVESVAQQLANMQRDWDAMIRRRKVQENAHDERIMLLEVALREDNLKKIIADLMRGYIITVDTKP